MGYTPGHLGFQSGVAPALPALEAALGNHQCLKNGHNASFLWGGYPVQG